MKKLVIVNFKAFQNSTGQNAVKLARICEKVGKKAKTEIIIAVQTADIYRVSKSVKIKVLAQHIDPINYGQFTGHILPENVKENGAIGALINHSEKKLRFNDLKKTIKKAKELDLLTIVCAATPEEAKKIASLKPDFIAIEPPELIGSNISVSQAKPEIITRTTKMIKNIPILCGAGIKTKEDVRIAVRLGAKGILVAHAITNATNPEKALKELVNGLN